jgi:predicted O-methyltransferase YrrM
MNNTKLEKIISETQSNPYIKWNDESLTDLIRNDNVYNVFMFNKDGNHGYFSLLHNLTSNIEGTIVELGNREGLGILSIYDALGENSELYTLDIVDDVRFINDKIKSDSRVHILNDFNSLDVDRIEKTFEKKSISMIFLDTIHTYEQVTQEFKLWEPYMKDDCVMLIDDIRDYMPGRTKWRFHTELDYTYKYDVTEWAHNDTGYGVYLK